MPFYHLDGRLAYFHRHAHHIGMYPFTLEEARAVGLDHYVAAKATLQFPLDRPLTLAAIRNLIEQGEDDERTERLDNTAIIEVDMADATNPEDPTAGGSPALVVDHLTKRFGERMAFQDVSFTVAPGKYSGSSDPTEPGRPPRCGPWEP